MGQDVIPQEVSLVAAKLKFEIQHQGKHPKGGNNFEVICPSLDGSQSVSGCDSMGVTRDGKGFYLIRNVVLQSASITHSNNMMRIDVKSGESIREEKSSEKIVKVTYVFSRNAVQRVLTMENGDEDVRTVLP